MESTKPPRPSEYETFTSKQPDSPAQIQPYIEARKQVTELDRQLKYINAIDNTRQAFADYY